jgi:hypothetical protein
MLLRIGPGSAERRFTLRRVRDMGKAKEKPRPEGTPGGVSVRSYHAHIRLRGARTGSFRLLRSIDHLNDAT